MADEAQLKVRLLRTLKEKVDIAAAHNRRTLNAEIVARLDRTFIEDAERNANLSGLGFIRKAKENAAAAAALPVPDAEARISALETAVLGLLVELRGLKEKVSG